MSTRTPVVRLSRRNAVVAAVTAVVAAGAVAGCGSSGSSSSSSSTPANANVSASLSQAQKVLEQSAARPTNITVSTPIQKPIPTGKKLVFISCGAAQCQLQGNIVKEAASHLGWTSQTIATDGSPEKIQSAFATALRNGADAVILNATTRAAIAKQLAEAKAKGVAFVGCCSTDSVGDGYLYNTSTPAQNGKIGKYLAAAVAADAKGKDASTLYVDIPAFTILGALGDAFKGAYQQLCQGCKYNKISIALPQLANAPNTIVSYLRSHPDTKYVALSVTDALGTGLPAALKAAGLNDIKIVGQGGDPTAFQALAQGQMLALVPFDYYDVDYQMVDALARHFTGQKIEQTPPPLWLLTKDNLPSSYTKLFPNVEDYQSQFLKLWGKQQAQ
jgi:ABC-type sugar transport system substrate-binding protein